MKKIVVVCLLTVIAGSNTFAYRNHDHDSHNEWRSCCDRDDLDSHRGYGRHRNHRHNDIGSHSSHRGNRDHKHMRSDSVLPIAQQQEISKIDFMYDKTRLEIKNKYENLYIPLYSEREQIGIQLDNMYGMDQSQTEITKLLDQLNKVENKIIDIRDQERAEVRKIKNDKRDAIQKIEIDFLNSKS